MLFSGPFCVLTFPDFPLFILSSLNNLLISCKIMPDSSIDESGFSF